MRAPMSADVGARFSQMQASVSNASEKFGNRLFNLPELNLPSFKILQQINRQRLSSLRIASTNMVGMAVDLAIPDPSTIHLLFHLLTSSMEPAALH